MRYDFDTVVERRGTGSLKWDSEPDVLPLWVADMDFQAAPEIREAFEEKIRQGVFGYSILTDDWYNAYLSWWKKRHHFVMQKEWLVFSTGVVPIISSCVRKLTTPNENVVILTPVYNVFFNSILNNGCRVLESPLSYEDGTYKINWKDLEKKLADPQTSLLIFCNPHNPIGRLWDRDTLSKIGELCRRYGVIVISDEIHCDLTEPGTEYVPFASVSDTCRDLSITCLSATKCFNLAGIQTACACVPNPFLRHKVWRALNTDEVGEPGSFAVPAAVAAFTKGEAWLNELNEYISQNRAYVRSVLAREVPEIYIVPAQATYLMWLDCSGLKNYHRMSGKVLSDELSAFLKDNAGVYLTSGAEYGSCGRQFLRLNLACPRSTLSEGMKRFCKGIEAWRSSH